MSKPLRPTILPPIVHPMGYVAIVLSAGIIVGDQFEFDAIWLLGSGLLNCVVVFFLRTRLFLMLATSTVVFVSGMSIQSLSRCRAATDFAHVVAGMDRDDRAELTVSGRIQSFVTEDSTRIRFDFLMERIHGTHHIVPVSGIARTTVLKSRKPHASKIDLLDESCVGSLRGMRVALQGAAYRPSANMNPADFDYRAFLDRKGVSTLIFVKNIENCRVLEEGSDPIAIIRLWFKNAVKKVVPSSSSALSTALITGDRSGLDSITRRQFAESGLMHLLAISGLHVMFVGLTAYGLFKSILTRFRLDWRPVETVGTLLTLGLLTVYTLITGATPSVFRASVMAAFLLSGRPLYRTSNSLNSLGTAAVVVLLVDSNNLFTAGFQLSFLAVFGLITAGATVSRWVNRRFSSTLCRWVYGLLGASSVATLSTAPVMISQFGYIPLAGLALNLIAIPLASGLLVASICAALMSSTFTSVATSIGYAADLLSTLLDMLAEFGGSSASWSLIRLAVQPASLAVPFLVTLSMYPGLVRQVRVVYLFLAFGLPAGEAIYSASTGQYKPFLDVVFFDIGHGDAALVRFPSGKTMLVDAGDRSRSWDWGDRVIIPHLNRELISQIDAVVVSHPHGDHFGGLPSILHHIPVDCVYDNGNSVQTNLFREYTVLVSNNVSCHEAVSAGDVLDIDPSARVQVLAPLPGYEAEGENNESVVFKITFGSTSFLFPGDVEKEAEQIMGETYCDQLQSDVVKVPHHGSRTSSSPVFVNCSSPRWAIVSVGSEDKYGLPDDEVLNRWDKNGAIVLTTHQNGAILMRSDGQQIRIIK